MHEQDEFAATVSVPEQQYLRGLAGVAVVLAVLLVGAVAFVRYLL